MYQYPERFVRHVSIVPVRVGAPQRIPFPNPRSKQEITTMDRSFWKNCCRYRRLARGIGRGQLPWLWPRPAPRCWSTTATARRRADAVRRRNPQGRRPRRGKSVPTCGRRTGRTFLAKRVRAIVGDRLDILVCQRPASRRRQALRTPRSRISTTCSPVKRSVRRSSWCSSLLPVFMQGQQTSSSRLRSLPMLRSERCLPMRRTKGAVDTLVKHFASALGPRGIRVNAVAPGVVENRHVQLRQGPRRVAKRRSACRH